MRDLDAISMERYRGGGRIARLYGGQGTVTRFSVFAVVHRHDYSKHLTVEGFGPTPGERKTFAMNAARPMLAAKGWL